MQAVYTNVYYYILMLIYIRVLMCSVLIKCMCFVCNASMSVFVCVVHAHVYMCCYVPRVCVFVCVNFIRNKAV